jgi:hypothetical protein
MFVVVSDREIEAISHEIDISLYRLGGYLNVGREGNPVGMTSSLDGLEDLVHPINRRPSQQLPVSNSIFFGRGTFHVPHGNTARNRVAIALMVRIVCPMVEAVGRGLFPGPL